jgi:SAM-dependent methyltransferase
MSIPNRQFARRLSLIGASSVVFVSVFCLAGWTQEAAPPKLGELNDRLAPFVPTPMPVVEEMLKLAEVDKHDRVYDLGSGDGRIVIMAAQKFGAEAVGVELDDRLFKESAARIVELGLERRARILHENMYAVSLRPATVVTLYLLTSVNERLKPLLERDLRPGARVVTHDFKIPGWEPKATREVISENGISHTVYLYVRP